MHEEQYEIFFDHVVERTTRSVGSQLDLVIVFPFTAWILSCWRFLKLKKVKKDHVVFAESEVTLGTLRSFDKRNNEDDRRPPS